MSAVGGTAVGGEPAQARILVACVGNVLRGDDGFGPAVATRLEGKLPAGVELVETGIGGVALLQELLAGCSGLVLIDAVDRGAEPGRVFVLAPDVGEGAHVPDVHLANPDRVLSIAKSMGALPARLLIVGCQVGEVDELGGTLSAPVERAVDIAAQRVQEAVDGWL